MPYLLQIVTADDTYECLTGMCRLEASLALPLEDPADLGILMDRCRAFPVVLCTQVHSKSVLFRLIPVRSEVDMVDFRLLWAVIII